MIKDLRIGDIIRGQVFYCSSKTSGISSKGDTYYTVMLQDASGTISAKIWQMGDSIQDFSSNMFVSIEGRVTAYNDTPQINITSCSVVPASMVDISDYCAKSPKDMDEMIGQLETFVRSVQNPFLGDLLSSFFMDEVFLTKFKEHSAGKSIHHAYVGGLLEHTLDVTRICETLASQYPAINRDLLITAALFHDIGKVQELTTFPENDYSDEGTLLGHLFIGAEMIGERARKIEGFPENLLKELQHCILSHHGDPQYGAVKQPMIIEAVALSFADDTDAKLRRFSDMVGSMENTWTDKQDFAFGSKLRKTLL